MNIDQKAFSIWLFSQPPERVIESANGSNCFMCSFLKETSMAVQPVFTWNSWWSGCDDIKRAIPDWALRLIDPEWCRENGNEPCVAITAGQMQQRYRELFPELPLRPDGAPDLKAIFGKALKPETQI